MLENQDSILSLLTVGVLVINLLIAYFINSMTLYTVAKAEKNKNAVFAWIPVLNNYLLIKLGKGKSWMLVFLFATIIPIIGIFFNLIFCIYAMVMMWRLCERYNTDKIFLILGCFFPILILVPYYQIYKNAKAQLR